MKKTITKLTLSKTPGLNNANRLSLGREVLRELPPAALDGVAGAESPRSLQVLCSHNCVETF